MNLPDVASLFVCRQSLGLLSWLLCFLYDYVYCLVFFVAFDYFVV